MNASLKITRIGEAAAVVLPDSLLARLRVGVGDTLYLTETPEGLRLTVDDPESDPAMEIAERIMAEDRDILRILAK